MPERSPSETTSAPVPRPMPRSRRRSWLSRVEALAFGLLAAAVLAAAAQTSIGPYTGPYTLVILLTALVVGLHLVGRNLWPSKVSLVGPLFFYDAMRLARRGRSTLLRVTFAVVLFAGLVFIYNERFPQQRIFRQPFAPGPTVAPADVGQFTNIFVGIILTLQALAVLVLTPAYLAGAIAEEKERRTLELLFTTHLTDREIVLGKLFARMLHLGGVLLVSLPVLSILQLWGGANPLVIGAAFAVCAFSLLSIGSVSILCSVLARNVIHAMLFTYAVVFLVSFGCLCVPDFYVSSPLTFMAALEDQMGTSTLQQLFLGRRGMMGSRPPVTTDLTMQLAVMVGTYGFVHLLIAAFCLSLAVAVVRATALGQAESAPLRPPPVERALVPVARPVRAADDPVPVRRRPLPHEPRGEFYRAVPIGTHPLLWKEVYHGAVDSLAPIAWLAPIVLFILFAVFVMLFLPKWHATGISFSEFTRTYLNPVVRVGCSILGGIWAGTVAFLAGRSITREREQQTLDGLLTLPVERESILGAKWLGSILRWRSLGYGVAILLGLGLFTGAVHPLGIVLLALAIAIHIAFLASVGVCLSLVSRNTLWANFTMALMLLLVFVGSSVVLMYSQALGGFRSRQSRWETFAEFGLNPPRAWWHLAFTWDQFHDEILHGDGLFRGTYGATLAGMLAFAVAAGVFWWAARAQFRKEQVRERT
jgi:ABC-type transport system involved in multi-copper enzyme maturation permease subunit